MEPLGFMAAQKCGTLITTGKSVGNSSHRTRHCCEEGYPEVRRECITDGVLKMASDKITPRRLAK